MGRRKLEDRSVRSLNKTSSGKSYSVTLPVEIIRMFRWKNKQKLVVKADKKRKRIVIEDWKS
jgi:bifunctional DNA-binding transcriptional regulator/antitoxin component of YhaV-PrlF toxin-antitoxin module